MLCALAAHDTPKSSHVGEQLPLANTADGQIADVLRSAAFYCTAATPL